MQDKALTLLKGARKGTTLYPRCRNKGSIPLNTTDTVPDIWSLQTTADPKVASFSGSFAIQMNGGVSQRGILEKEF